MMKAKVRLFFNADRTKLHREGHLDAAILYVAPGDEIPDTAVELFGLVEGDVADEATAEVIDAILRIATLDGSIEIVGFTFSQDWTLFAAEMLDEAQLLAILKEPLFLVQAKIEGTGGDWIDFPGREFAIEILQEHVNYDLLHGLPHRKVAPRSALDELHPADVAKEARLAEEARLADEARRAEEERAAAAAANTRPVGDPSATETQEPAVEKSAAPVPAKEAKPASNKEAKPAANKEAKAPANKAKDA